MILYFTNFFCTITRHLNAKCEKFRSIKCMASCSHFNKSIIKLLAKEQIVLNMDNTIQDNDDYCTIYQVSPVFYF